MNDKHVTIPEIVRRLIKVEDNQGNFVTSDRFKSLEFAIWTLVGILFTGLFTLLVVVKK